MLVTYTFVPWNDLVKNSLSPFICARISPITVFWLILEIQLRWRPFCQPPEMNEKTKKKAVDLFLLHGANNIKNNCNVLFHERKKWIECKERNRFCLEIVFSWPILKMRTPGSRSPTLGADINFQAKGKYWLPIKKKQNTNNSKSSPCLSACLLSSFCFLFYTIRICFKIQFRQQII